MRRSQVEWEEPNDGVDPPTEASAVLTVAAEAARSAQARPRRQSTEQYPMQILVPAETREALRQRSAETGASIRYIILRSLAADGFPVPKLNRWNK
ncbi:hypothetical protein [Acidisoma sp. C75]